MITIDMINNLDDINNFTHKIMITKEVFYE